jgi:type IV pilus assembly protein PilB
LREISGWELIASLINSIKNWRDVGGVSMANASRLLGEILIEMGCATAEQIDAALECQMNGERARLGEILHGQGICTADDITTALAEQFNMEIVDLAGLEINTEAAALLSAEFCRENHTVPIGFADHVLTVAISDPLDLQTIDQAGFVSGFQVESVLASPEAIESVIGRLYSSKTHEDIFAGITHESVEVKNFEANRDLNDSSSTEADAAPVVKLVNLIIAQAVQNGASDIHIEPMLDRLCVRYRIDGVCSEVDSPPKRLQGAIIARIKIMAALNMAERRRPQDGKIQMRLHGRPFDLRVSALPAAHGESVVMRILDKATINIGLDQLGLHTDDSAIFRNLLKKPSGLLLITGPTGSGKTTTLYSALNELNTPDRKIITVENPVEYTLGGINQVQVNEAVGMTFKRALRAILRQAPNIILIGEIRDKETAHAAIEASLTGHLVFATLHTSDAPSALSRLIELEVAPFLVASSVQAVQAQRLVRILCPECKRPEPLDRTRLKSLGLRESQFSERQVYASSGCQTCRYKGFRGRKGIYEIMVMNRRLRELCFQKANTDAIRKQAIMDGMKTLLDDGLRKVCEGWTTLDEVLSEARVFA